MLVFFAKLKNMYYGWLHDINNINDKSNINNIENLKSYNNISKINNLDSITNYDENVCCRCAVSKNNYIRHCERCDDCHDNRKTLYCELCNICINYISEIDIIMHRKRHTSLILLKNKRFGRHNSI